MLKSTHKPINKQTYPDSEPPLPEGWTEHTAPTGHKYYYNSSTKQSTYTRPAPVAEESNHEDLLIDFNATAPSPALHATALALDEFHRNSNTYQQPQSTIKSHRGHGGDRPKHKQPIPGAEPWILVKTKYGRRFVHNTETKQSLWKFPQDVMMAVIEMDRLDWLKKQKQKDEAIQAEQDEKSPDEAKGRTAVERANAARRQEQTDLDEDDEDEDYEEVEVTDNEDAGTDNGAAKRPRLDSQTSPPTGPLELTEDDIEWQLAQMDQDSEDDRDYDDAEGDAAENPEDEEGLPLTEEDNVALFRSLLDDNHISPFATFDKVIESEAIIEDYRYTALPNMHRRREVFADWSRDRAAELQAAKAQRTANNNIDPKVEYLAFLQKYATPKLYWPEFKRKYRKDAEMTNYKLSDKEREKLYREMVAKMKMPESDRRREILAVLKGAKDELKGIGRLEGMPVAVLKDVRFYVVDERKRLEIVEGFLSTL